MSNKTIEELEEERLMRNITKGKPQTQAQTQAQTQTQAPKTVPQKSNISQPPQQPQQPQKQWKYQQKQQQNQGLPGMYGPVMNLSTRVNYLNSLLDQGSIDENEYQQRAEVLQTIGKFVAAVQAGDANTLDQLIKDNPLLDLNHIQENEATIIHIAIESILKGRGDTRVLELLCRRGIAIDAFKNGWTPLLSLCQYISQVKDAEKCVRVLLDNGASVKATVRLSGTSSETRTCLDLALINNGPVEVLRLLCERGADPNVSTEDGPILNHCCIYGKVEEARVLLEFRANPNSRVPQVGANCLASAINDGNIELVKLLLKHGADKNAPVVQSQGKENALALAKATKNEQLVSLLQ